MAGICLGTDDQGIFECIQERSICNELFAPSQCGSDDGCMPDPS